MVTPMSSGILNSASNTAAKIVAQEPPKVADINRGVAPIQPTSAALPTAAASLPANWAVGPSQTVASNVKDIISDNSPLMQQAETRANQRMNQRGLLNSSIAVGAGQSALYDAALPIAQADAQTQARAGEFNAGAQQQTSLANQNSQNQMAQFNAGETNKFVMQNVDSTTKTALANIQANYQMLMQSSGDASRLYQQMVTNAANIMSNKDMDSGAKQAAINNQVTLLNNGLNVLGQIGNLNLKDLLQFGDPGMTVSPPAAVPSPNTLSPMPGSGSGDGSSVR
jgi:hypothetical protein